MEKNEIKSGLTAPGLALQSEQARRILATHRDKLQTAIAIVADALAEEIRERIDVKFAPDAIVENPLIEAMRDFLTDLSQAIPKPD